MERILNKIFKEITNKNSVDEKEYFLFHQHRFKYILRLLKIVYDNKKSLSLLDVGSHYLHMILGAYYLNYRNLFGIDLNVFSSAMQGRAGKFNAILKNGDLSKDRIPFNDSSFDVVLLTETLEHFNFHPQGVFKEIFRVLKMGGVFIITTPNLFRLNNRIKFFLGKSINYNIKEDYTIGTHYREYSAKEIDYLLNIAGFKNYELKYADFNYPHRKRLEIIINKIFGFIFPKLKSNIIVIATK